MVFADDLMIFTRGDKNSVSIISQTLKQFGLVSGLHCNPKKSKIFAAGITQENFLELQQLSQFSPREFPMKYLGLPLVHGKTKCSLFSPLHESISNRLKDWSTGYISYAGRVELITAVIQGVEAFWLQVFPMPSTIIDRIIKMCRNFFWAGGRAKVAWTDVCKPKSERGLGLRNYTVWNKALLLKLFWDIMNEKNILWV